jgi:hypothetical protein
VGPIISLTTRTAPRPRWPPSDSGLCRLAHAHGFTAVVSCSPFPPPRRHHPPPRAALRGAHRWMSSSFLSSSSAHAPPLLLLTPCQCQPPRPATGAPPESPTSSLPGRPSFCSFLLEKAPKIAAAATFPQPPNISPRQASPATLPLHRCHPNDRLCPDHLPESWAADHHHRMPPLTTVPLRLSRAPRGNLPSGGFPFLCRPKIRAPPHRLSPRPTPPPPPLPLASGRRIGRPPPPRAVELYAPLFFEWATSPAGLGLAEWGPAWTVVF